LRGIRGLQSQTAVRKYWRAWDYAIFDGMAQPVKLGDEVELPDAEWADYSRWRGRLYHGIWR
jgi:hypothetical protein